MAKRNAKDEICFALFVLLRRHDYESITVSDIAERAGVSRMTFYRHFVNKEDVFIYYADERFDEFIHIIRKLKNGTIEDFLIALFNFLAKYEESLKVLIKTGKYGIMLDKYEQYFNYIYHKFSLYDDHYKLLNKYTVSFISGGIYNATYKWLKNNSDDDPEAIAHQLVEVFDKFAKMGVPSIG